MKRQETEEGWQEKIDAWPHGQRPTGAMKVHTNKKGTLLASLESAADISWKY